MIRCTHRAIDCYDLPKAAVFLDRDGTLTEDRGFITEPSQIQLVENACVALNSLRSAGFAIVLITNQSAIGRGLIDDDQLYAIHSELITQLASSNAHLDAIYYCPEAPISSDETIIESHDRKPGPGMLLAAASDLNLDLPNSWMIGDRFSDILAGQNAGCRGSILIRSSRQSPDYEALHCCTINNTLRDAAVEIHAPD